MDASHSQSPLSAEDLAVVRQAVREIEDAPSPKDRAGLGCALSLPGFVVLLVLPIVARRFTVPPSVARVVLIVGLAVLVVGVLIWLTAGGFVRGHFTAAAAAALRRLEAWDVEEGDREEALRAATLLLMNAYAVYGPTMGSSFDRDEARERLGAMMPLVEAVERVLVEEAGIYTVFTDEPETEAEEEEAP